MKKIGIITINDNDNYGNRLQNYAVQEILKKLNIKPITITRKGAGHDTESTEYNMPSASFLRKLSRELLYNDCISF